MPSLINWLERQGIIEPVDGETPWVSPFVVTLKPKNPDQNRVCVDMRQPNRAILRERHITRLMTLSMTLTALPYRVL